jgi:hypothetical protein
MPSSAARSMNCGMMSTGSPAELTDSGLGAVRTSGGADVFISSERLCAVTSGVVGEELQPAPRTTNSQNVRVQGKIDPEAESSELVEDSMAGAHESETAGQAQVFNELVRGKQADCETCLGDDRGFKIKNPGVPKERQDQHFKKYSGRDYSESAVSPSERVPAAHQVSWLTFSLTNLTELSTISTWTPPVWALEALIALLPPQSSV